MTNENIIKQLKRLIPSLQYADDVNAVKGAIKALSQEPCIYDLKDRYCPRLNEHGMLKHQEPCDDAISRILQRMWNCRGKHTTSIDKVKMEQIIRDELPSVTPSRPIDIEIRDLKWQIASKDQVVEDIKNDIRHIVDEESENDEKWARGLHYALCIIEKHWNYGCENG